MKSKYINTADDLILVTGANGFIGARVVQILLEYGFTNLRCFVRPSSRPDRLRETLGRFPAAKNVHLVFGDLLAREDCAKAAVGVSTIYHLAAGFDKSFAGAFMGSALTTRNLMDAFLERGQPKRFVNVSSFAVYSNLRMKRGSLLDENCPLENAPQERFNPYGFGKIKQEELVREYGSKFKLPFVILRPGAVFGPGKRELNGRIGTGVFGFFINVGGSNVLPLTYVDNCAEAIVLAGLRPGVDGETFNVVDNGLPTCNQLVRAYKKRVPGFHCFRLPYPLAYALSVLWENYSKKTKGQLPPAFNRRRCSAEWKGNRYSNEKLRQRLGWEPRVNMERAIAMFLEQFDRPAT